VELAHTLMHPSSKVDREYACRVRGPVDPGVLQRLKKGVKLEDGPANFSDIVAAGGSEGNLWFHVTILEGRNREVRRLWASQGIRVSRLKRVRYGAVFLPKRLRMGKFHELSPADYQVLREDVGLDAPSPELVLHRQGKGKKGGKKTRK
jgi:23S rRNA pseudouridine2605 synthase